MTQVLQAEGGHHKIPGSCQSGCAELSNIIGDGTAYLRYNNNRVYALSKDGIVPPYPHSKIPSMLVVTFSTSA